MQITWSLLYPCHDANPSFNSVDVIENLTKYGIWQIDNFYQDFIVEYNLDDRKRKNFNRLFGYDSIKSHQGAEEMINLSLTNISNVIKAIAEFYIFWKESYNAYKHGYRLWYGHEYRINLKVALYLRRFDKVKRQISWDRLPVDDETINDVYNFIKYCRHVFDIIFDNHRALLKAGKTSTCIQFAFLEYKESVTRIIKKKFNI